MDEFLKKLAAHRRRIRIARTVETTVRWAFHASVVACAYLTVSKLTELPAAGAALLVAVPLALAVRQALRPFSLRDCAVALDRLLRLDERLATALEASGSMAAVQAADAAGALSRAAFPRRPFPKEGKLLGGSLLLTGVLLVIPSPARAGAAGDPALEALAKKWAVKLEAFKDVDPRFSEAAEQVRRQQLEKAFPLLKQIRDRIDKTLIQAGDAGGRLKEARDAAAAGAGTIAGELSRRGITIYPSFPDGVAEKLEFQARKGSESALPAPVPNLEPTPDDPKPSGAMRRRSGDWDAQYDIVIRNYFGSRK